MGYRIAVDTGGTFSDVVVTDGVGGFGVGKALGDPRRATASLRAALDDAARAFGCKGGDLLRDADLFLYGTTRCTNAIVEGAVARTAFLTTEGFPDTLVLKEGGKFDAHRLDVPYPEPYIPRRYSYEVRERINAEGGVEIPLDREALAALLAAFPRRGIEAIAVCFLWSIANPVHELQVGEAIEALLPGVPYTLSHQLNPILREYRRASSTAIDASLKPLAQSYLGEMEADLRGEGYGGDVLTSTSFGGVMHLADVVERPIYLVKSGPAMAPVAGLAYAASEAAADNAIICDAGGTTFDVSLIRDGQIESNRETWLGPRWTGHSLGMASVAVHSIGAGGGSIAWVDPGELLRVGPRSAGADPGPACYGRGGHEATVTDAAVVLGYLDPAHFLGGRMALDAAAAERVVGALADTLHLPLQRAAFAVITVATEAMIQAILEITTNEGLDPRDSILVAGGGAGGFNAAVIARELGCPTVLVPRTAGALSASGMQFSDIVTEAGASRLTTSEDFDYRGVNSALQDIGARLEAFAGGLRDRGVVEVELRYFVEARYRFQVWELEIPLPESASGDAAGSHGGGHIDGAEAVAALVDTFHQVHERVFAVRDAEQPIEFLNWRGRLTARVDAASRPPAPAPPSRAAAGRPARRRHAYFGAGASAVETSIYEGGELAPGSHVDGPAIIEEATSTLVVPPDAALRISPGGHYLLTPRRH